MMKRPPLIAAFAVLVAAQLQPWTRAAALYFPPASAEWDRAQPGAAGWDERALDTALDYAGRTNSSGVVVLLNGKILAERRWRVEGPEPYRRLVIGKTAGGDVVEDVASVQKSVVAFLAGVAEGRRLIDLEAPASDYLGRGWSKANEEAEFAITVRHLMTMTSGLTDSGEYQAPAGQTWRYNTGMYSKIVGILEKAAGAGIEKLTADWLTGPAGMSDSKWVRRAWSAGNDAANSVGFATTPRDLARFGLLILANGSWNGRDLLRNSSYFERMLRPSQDLNPSYGLLWWLNGQARVQRPSEAVARPGSLTPSAPRDLVAALGAQDRKCFVVPSLGLVVTRLGAPTSRGSTLDAKWDDEFWKLLMKAAPAARTK
jgi:CubicO group peptidase (beta-lactamase class C family)